mgnify:CR=1 FL=1
MPNYCNNHITITGPKKVIERLNKSIQNNGKQEGGFLDALVPMPHEIKHTQADGTDRPNLYMKYGHNDWYGWANNNWGTKWNVYANDFYPENPKVELTADDENFEAKLEFGFDTAWAPPIGAYENYLAENQDVTIKATYFEGGMDFMGIWEDYDDNEYTISDVTDEQLTTEPDLMLLEDMYNILESREMYREELKEEETVDG